MTALSHSVWLMITHICPSTHLTGLSALPRCLSDWRPKVWCCTLTLMLSMHIPLPECAATPASPGTYSPRPTIPAKGPALLHKAFTPISFWSACYPTQRCPASPVMSLCHASLTQQASSPIAPSLTSMLSAHTPLINARFISCSSLSRAARSCCIA